MTQARYRIRAVSEMTGVPSPTLRAWERRYGVPEPRRTDSSYRLYDESDVRMINRLRALIEGGMAPAEAAEMVRPSADPGPATAVSTPPPVPPPAGEAAGAHAAQVERLVEAAVRYDVATLKAEVARALGLGNAQSIFRGVLGPALLRVEGAGVEGATHLAREVLGNAVRQLVAWVEPSAPTRRALLASVSGSSATLPLYGLALSLAECGCQGVVLGADVPPASVQAAVAGIRPNLVLLWPGDSRTAEEVALRLGPYRDAVGTCPWAVVGPGAWTASAELRSLGAHVVSDDPTSLRPLLA